MAKRAADGQLTKDDADREDGAEGETESSGGIATAPQAEIAARPIRGMPRPRAVPSNPANAAAVTAPSTSGTAPSFTFGAPAGMAGAGMGPFGLSSGSSTGGFGSTSGTGAFGAGVAPTSSSFSFVGVPSAAVTQPVKSISSFGFGNQPAAATAAPTSAFGSSTGSRGPPTFSFGTKPTSVSADTTTTPSSLFGGFPSTSTGKATQVTTPASSGPTKPFAGFSFTKPTSESPAVTLAPTPPALASELKTAAESSLFSSPAPTGFAPPPSVASSKSPFGLPSSSPSISNQPVAKPASEGSALGSFFASTSATRELAPTSKVPAHTPAPSTADAPAPLPSVPNGSSGATTSPGTNHADKESSDTDYLIAIRGLNESVVRAFQTRLVSMPFANLSVALDGLKREYEAQLKVLQEKAGINVDVDVDTRSFTGEVAESPKAAPGASAPSASTGTAGPGGFRFGAQPAFQLLSSSSIPASTSVSGFKPSIPETAAASSAPSFGASAFGQPKAPESVTVKTADRARPQSEASKFVQGILDEGEAADASPAGEGASTSNPATIAPVPPPQKRAASPAPDNSPAPNKRQSALFSIKPSVKPGTEPSMVVPAASSSGSPLPFVFKAAVPNATPSPFGSSNPAGSPVGFGFSMPPVRRVASTGFGFGKVEGAPEAVSGPSTATQASAFSFGSPSMVTPSFSFGSASSASSSKPFASTGTFSFGGPSNSAKAPEPNPATLSAEDSLPADSQLDLASTSAGEEDEDIVWESQLGINSMPLGGAWSKNWVACNVRLLRTKPGAEGPQGAGLGRRFVMRASSTGVIAQNFSLKSIIKVEVKEKTIHLTTASGPDIKEVALSFGKASEERTVKMNAFRTLLRGEFQAAEVNAGEL